MDPNLKAEIVRFLETVDHDSDHLEMDFEAAIALLQAAVAE